VRPSHKVEIGVIAVLTDALRVARADDRQWCLEQRNARTWTPIAYCGTKEGLLVRIKDWLLKDHLGRFYQVNKVKAIDPESGRLKHKVIVSQEALDATDAARAALKRGDMTRFNVDPGAWASVLALPDFYPKPANEKSEAK